MMPPAAPAAFLNLWSSLHALAEEQGKYVLEWSAPLWNPRLLQKQWIRAWSQAMDGYLRSPAFLDHMQHNIRMIAPADPTRHPVVPSDRTGEGDSRR